MDPTFLPATQLADLVRRRQLGSLELLDHYIARVERLDPRINAVVVRNFEPARKRARALDQSADRSAPLFGVPMTVKESYDVAGLPTTWGVSGFRDHTATNTALVVQRLIDAGAVVFGKTNVPVLLADYQSYNPIYGTTNNPWNASLSPGGSSGGGAAALAAGFCGLEAGSDIAGSLRNPAHYCGVFSHKPTWGICPPLGHSLAGAVSRADINVVGPMARSATDLAVSLEVMAGAEPIEAGWKLDLPAPRISELKGLRVAMMKDHLSSEVDTSITEAIDALAGFLRRAGATVSLDARPDFDLALGNRLFIEMLRATTSTRIDKAALARWRDEAARLADDDTSYYGMMARGVSMSHRDFLVGNETREKMRRLWSKFFDDWDVFLCPAAASPAQKHDHQGERWQRTIEVNGHNVSATDQMFWAGIAGFYLLPATIAPLAVTPTGLPIGVQIIGPQYGDRMTIALAALLEKEWRGFSPPPGWM